jgi:RNA polymerase sigma-70 factor (ECF subfamily)
MRGCSPTAIFVLHLSRRSAFGAARINVAREMRRPCNNAMEEAVSKRMARAGDREAEWADLMRRANGGDAAAYRRLLEALAPVLRAATRRGFARAGKSEADAEDVVQETLLAIHLKRHTWDSTAPLGPWVRAIARNKLIDALRRRGRRLELPIEDFSETLAAADEEKPFIGGEIDRLLGVLSDRQREVVRAMTVDGMAIREVGTRLGMSDGAVRVALHRGLAALARAMKGKQ